MSNQDTLVMYMRISLEDREHPAKEKRESNSIINQRSLLKDYIEKSRELAGYLVTELCDDGYSGTNLERPGMKRLLEMVKKRQVGCIIVKDFSRFGRDYLVVSDYIDQIFPFLGIRFISVNDHYDSAACNGVTSGIDMAFRNVLYGYYSYDLSIKVKSAKRTKAEKGEFQSAFAPLGYQKMPQNKNQLVIEPEGAAIVRKIFGLAGTGMNVLQITRWLNQEHIPTPCQIKSKQGQFHKCWGSKGERRIWDRGVVRNILRDERYLGKNIYGKRECVKVGDFHSRVTSPKDWIRAEHCHEPIVSEAEFAAARRSVREYVKKEGRSPVTHLFSGKIRCGVCGHSMWYIKRASAPYYRCMTWKNTGEDPCIKDQMKEGELVDVVLSAIQLYVKVLLDKNVVREKGDGGGRIPELQKQLTTLQADKKELRERKAMMYDRLADGQFSREEFKRRQETITCQQEEVQQQYDKLQKELSHLEYFADTSKMQEKQWEDYLNAKELTRGMVEALIDCIYVYRDASVHICWKFGDGVTQG